MRRTLTIGTAAFATLGTWTDGAAAKTNACRNSSAKQWLKTSGPVLQTLRSGQYYAFRQRGANWTFCDSRRPGRARFKSFSFSGTTGAVKLLSRPNKCLALQLNAAAGSPPLVPSVDMRPAETNSTSSVNWVERGTPGSKFVKVELSSTCLLGIAYLGASGGRGILLTPVTPPAVLIDTIALSPGATDADLRAMKIDGNNVSWADAGEPKSKTYVGTQ